MLRRKQARPQGGKGQAVTSPVTTARDIPALLTRLRDEADQCRNNGAADIAALLDEAAGALEDVQEIARRGDEIILKLDQKLAAAQSSLTASEKRVQELEMQSRGNWIDAEQLAAVIRHAVWEADNQAGVIDVDKLRAAMEKANG